MATRDWRMSRRRLLSAIPLLAIPGSAWSQRAVANGNRANADKARQGLGDNRIGLALGAGGANGLAHITMLEVFDELQLRPHRIAGSSIGAVIGAMFASGMPAEQIRKLAESSFSAGDEDSVQDLLSGQALRWLELVELEVGEGGLLDSQRILSHFYRSIGAKTFADLEIPLDVVAGDLWNKEQVVLHDGSLIRAVQASMAIPGVFEPVEIDGKVLVDGGTVNPVPWDLLFDDCDIVIAIDVSGVRSKPESDQSGYFEILFNSIKLMQKAIVTEKMRNRKPDILIAPPIRDIRALEFFEAATVFEQAAPSQKMLRDKLSELLAD